MEKFLSVDSIIFGDGRIYSVKGDNTKECYSLFLDNGVILKVDGDTALFSNGEVIKVSDCKVGSLLDIDHTISNGIFDYSYNAGGDSFDKGVLKGSLAGQQEDLVVFSPFFRKNYPKIAKVLEDKGLVLGKVSLKGLCLEELFGVLTGWFSCYDIEYSVFRSGMTYQDCSILQVILTSLGYRSRIDGAKYGFTVSLDKGDAEKFVNKERGSRDRVKVIDRFTDSGIFGVVEHEIVSVDGIRYAG